MPGFESLEEDFLRISAEVAWATVATVDSKGHPRTRILHPYWEVVDGRPVGWVGTSRSPMKSKHLAANPFVSVAYWSPKQETAHAECRASWADDERERIWELYRAAEPPLGYDPPEPWSPGRTGRSPGCSRPCGSIPGG
jgi:pyridoxine/pyridoxamine 5'-phosphate oxidase